MFVAALVLITVVWGHGQGANPLELDDMSATASDSNHEASLSRTGLRRFYNFCRCAASGATSGPVPSATGDINGHIAATAARRRFSAISCH